MGAADCHAAGKSHQAANWTGCCFLSQVKRSRSLCWAKSTKWFSKSSWSKLNTTAKKDIVGQVATSPYDAIPWMSCSPNIAEYSCCHAVLTSDIWIVLRRAEAHGGQVVPSRANLAPRRNVVGRPTFPLGAEGRPETIHHSFWRASPVVQVSDRPALPGQSDFLVEWPGGGVFVLSGLWVGAPALIFWKNPEISWISWRAPCGNSWPWLNKPPRLWRQRFDSHDSFSWRTLKRCLRQAIPSGPQLRTWMHQSGVWFWRPLLQANSSDAEELLRRQVLKDRVPSCDNGMQGCCRSWNGGSACRFPQNYLLDPCWMWWRVLRPASRPCFSQGNDFWKHDGLALQAIVDKQGAAPRRLLLGICDQEAAMDAPDMLWSQKLFWIILPFTACNRFLL